MNTNWDCIVVGAGAAGLSAALVLGRARQRTLVVDAAGQSNRDAHGIGGLLGHDRRPPAEFYAGGRAELAEYPTVQLRAGEVVDGEPQGEGFVLELADGSREVTRRVLLATGMDYRYPPLPGIAERWGRSVFHCPFCHGWEVRDRQLAVLDRGASGVHRALLLGAWSEDVTLLADGPAELDAEDAQRLHDAGITVDERRVAGLRGPGSTLTGVVFADGDERPCGGLLVPVTLHQRSALAQRLGAAASEEPGPIAVDALQVDQTFATSAPGVSAAGDVAATMPSVANAIASGNAAAAMLVGALRTAPQRPTAALRRPAATGAEAGAR
ncbi:MAG: Thioredoxin reductase [uncultured Solirubrobacteraceae bacterium]|uniref:Thioredoxin reductase n=1 Tax=uncultured Solirubrobacteraceae bacterium TaxID=1162706 RepID=A0A6J4T6H4_9ACTN|nr:MAG: Thioredoxin reductase [uncultured Solirubrobacteraceae bacterium]